jgi:hypothetical protein
VNEQEVFVTDNLKLAAALTAAGFQIIHGERVIKDGREIVICELEQKRHGHKALYLQACFENKEDLPSQVEEIIRARGITPDEYALLAFDSARAGLHNRSTILFAVKNNAPLEHKVIGEGRSLIYRQGTPKSYLKKLIENA